MNKAQAKTAINPTRGQDYPEWYQQVIRAGELAENSSVRGCMVVKPWGYAIWEHIQQRLDRMIKDTGHVNAYFPLFIPMSYLEKEAQHVEGFAKECAVVTHHRLEDDGKGGLKPAGELTEPLIVRPTSETIIGESYAKWVKSYRDLPILLNQWANVVRWEMRPRLFLRTTEFLWQEGHTAHASEAEAREETAKMHEVYATFARDFLAMPVIRGEKTADERFPGAVNTFTIEAMMQDFKALQAGTSHFLGQNFAKAQNIRFLDQNGQEVFAWTTSWGVSTRLIGGLIMTHSDDNGLVLPPTLAPQQILILPIYRNADDQKEVLTYCESLQNELKQRFFGDAPLRVGIDDRDLAGGEKSWQAIKKGIPICLEIGPRDIKNDAVFMARRDRDHKDKESMNRAAFIDQATDLLQEIQDKLLSQAQERLRDNIAPINTRDELDDYFTQDQPGFALCPYDINIGDTGFAQVSEHLKKHKVSIRCIPMHQDFLSDSMQTDYQSSRPCIYTGTQTSHRVVIGRAY